VARWLAPPRPGVFVRRSCSSARGRRVYGISYPVEITFPRPGRCSSGSACRRGRARPRGRAGRVRAARRSLPRSPPRGFATLARLFFRMPEGSPRDRDPGRAHPVLRRAALAVGTAAWLSARVPRARRSARPSGGSSGARVRVLHVPDALSAHRHDALIFALPRCSCSPPRRRRALAGLATALASRRGCERAGRGRGRAAALASVVRTTPGSCDGGWSAVVRPQ